MYLDQKNVKSAFIATGLIMPTISG